MNDRELFVKMALDAWTRELAATSTLLDTLTDEQIMQEVSSGRNRGIYLLGHLTAEHDQMLALLRFQEAMHPELKPVFIDAPDRSIATLPAVQQLREHWHAVNDTFLDHARQLSPEEWFTRHANIPEADFPREPHRNRLNVLLSRTNHLAYHRGQLMLLAGR